MPVKSGAFGVAAAAAFSTAGLTAPCLPHQPAGYVVLGASCAGNPNQMPGISAAPDTMAADPASASFDLSGIAADISEPAEAEIFSNTGVKITRLEATMTANAHVATTAAFARAAQPHQTDDVAVYGLDYRSIKLMPKVPKKRPPVLGVGLSTVPSQPVKKTDTEPSGGSPWQSSPERDPK